MHYLKRNTKLGILSFLITILTLTNYVQILTKTDIYFSFGPEYRGKILKHNKIDCKIY